MVDAERMDVPRAVATSTGLIVNELVTNAFKYAFPDGRAGTVRVSLATTPDEVKLCVCDDGVGYMPGERKGLGTRLTAHLARQVGGSIHREDEQPGCRVVAQFPRPPLSSADSPS